MVTTAELKLKTKRQLVQLYKTLHQQGIAPFRTQTWFTRSNKDTLARAIQPLYQGQMGVREVLSSRQTTKEQLIQLYQELRNEGADVPNLTPRRLKDINKSEFAKLLKPFLGQRERQNILNNITSFRVESPVFKYDEAFAYVPNTPMGNLNMVERRFLLDKDYRVLLFGIDLEDYQDFYPQQRSIEDLAKTMMKQIDRYGINLGYTHGYIRLILVNPHIEDEEGDTATIVKNLFTEHLALNEIDEQDILNALMALADEHRNNEMYISFVSGYELGFYSPETEGGCHTGTREKKEGRFGLFVYSPQQQSKNNDCGIRCLQKFCQWNNLPIERRCAKIRKDCGLVKGEPVTLEQLTVLSEYAKANINVYNCRKELIKEISNPEFSVTEPLNLLLHNGHYQIITQFHYGVKWSICGQVMKRESTQKAHTCRSVLAYKANQNGGSFMYHKKELHVNDLIPEDDIYSLDFETFPLEKGNHEVYACGIAQGRQEPTIFEGRRQHQALDKTIDYLLNIPNPDKKRQIYCVAFNGSCYDFHFIMGQLVLRGYECKEITQYGKRIYRFVLPENNLIFWDLSQHLAGSLKKCLKEFDCQCAKGDFDHTKIKNYQDVLTYRSEWLPYLEQDVRGLAELTVKYRQVIKQVLEKANLPLIEPLNYVTLPNLSENVWRETVENIPIDKETRINKQLVHIPKEQQLIRDIRRATYGGRVSPEVRMYVSPDWSKFEKLYREQKNGVQNQEEVKKLYGECQDYLFKGDITSLYPSAMRYFEYPLGEPIQFDKEVDLDECKEIARSLNEQEKQNQFLLLNVDMVSTNRKLTVSPIPRPKYDHRGKRIGISWNIEDIKDEWYTDVDLELAIRHGFKITEVHQGYKWRGSGKVFDQFVDIFYELKSEEDRKEKSGEQFNSSLRTTAKGILTNLYGKLLENPHKTETKIILSQDAFQKFFKEHAYITDITYLSQGTAVTGGIRNKERAKLNTRPFHIGMFLLSYSRKIMLELMETIDPTLSSHFFHYTDTDSLSIPSHLLSRLEGKINPFTGREWLETGLCGFVNDYKRDAKVLLEKACSPKNYFDIVVDCDGNFKESFKSKGIPLKLLEEVKEKAYLEEEKVSVSSYRFKQVGTKLTREEKEKGFRPYEIRNVCFIRQFNPNWDNTDCHLVDGKYYPRGYRF